MKHDAARINAFRRKCEKLSGTIHRVRTDGTGGTTHVLITPEAFVLSERTGTWTRDIGEAAGSGPPSGTPAAGQTVFVNEARARIIEKLEEEQAEVTARLVEAKAHQNI